MANAIKNEWFKLYKDDTSNESVQTLINLIQRKWADIPNFNYYKKFTNMNINSVQEQISSRPMDYKKKNINLNLHILYFG